MSIVAKFRVTDIRKVLPIDNAPTYILEAVDDDDSGDTEHFARTVPVGKIKLRVDNPRARAQLELNEEYMVIIEPCN